MPPFTDVAMYYPETAQRSPQPQGHLSLINSTLPGIVFPGLFYHPLQRRAQVVMLLLQLLQPRGLLRPSKFQLCLLR